MNIIEVIKQLRDDIKEWVSNNLLALKSGTDEAISATKEELSEAIVAEAEEWKIVDENGNIIFKVDADGAHTTSMFLNGGEATTFSDLEELKDEIGNKLSSENDSWTIVDEMGNIVAEIDANGLMITNINTQTLKIAGKNFEDYISEIGGKALPRAEDYTF